MVKDKILIVEDERIIAEDLKRTLTRLGYEITGIASSSKVALEMAEVNIPDLVVMDIMLRGKTDGITTAQKLNDRFEIPSIYLTAYADKTILKRAKITAPYGYILKPFDVRELHINVEIALERNRTNRLVRRTNAVLRTVRDINQLIVREHDHQVLIKEACKILTREKVYPRSWIVLLDKEGKLTHSAQSGWGKNFQSLKNMLKEGKTPVCGERALLQKEIILSKRSEHCHNCPFQNYYPKYNNLTIALRSRGETFGLMSVALAETIQVSKEEQDLFEELAGDIAFALHDMELEEVLRSSDAMNRSLLERSPVCNKIIDLNFKLQYMSTAGINLLKIPDIKLYYGKKFPNDFYPQSARPKITKSLKTAMAGKISNLEAPAIDMEGNTLWFDTTFIPVFDKRKVKYIIATSVDITDNKEAEDLLKKSELKYRKITENSRLGMALYLKDGRYVFCNKRFSDITGYSVKEVQSPNFDFSELFSREDRKIIKMNSKRRFVGEKIPPYVLPIKTKNGREKFIEINNTLIHFQGQPAVQIQIMDVTTRKRAEKKLFESEKQLSLIYDTVGDVLFYLIVESDDCFRFRSVNQAFLDATGLDRDQIVGKPVNEVIPEPSLPMILDNYKKAIEEKRIVRWEETTEYPSGVKVGDVCIAPIFKDGICTHLVGSVHDITELKTLEERLQSERNEFNSILKNLPIGVTVLDTKDKVVYINPISIEIDGFKTNTDSLMGKNVRSIHPKHTLPTIEKLLADFKSGRKTHFSREAKRGKRTVEISYHTIRSEIGKYQGLTRLVSDITERKIAEKRITRLSRIFEESLNEIYLFDADNLIFTHVNSAAQQNLGYTMEELKNFTPLTLKPEFTVESFSKLIDPLKKGEKQKIIFETVHKRKDKSLYNVEVHLQLLTFENETLFAAIILDITERKQAEDALKESEAKFRGVIEESNDGIYVLQDDRFKFINPRFTEITGYELKEISSSNFDFKILFTDKGLEVLEEREALRIQGVEPPTRYIFEGLRKDGQRRDLEVSVTLIDWQGQPATLGIVSDVTERIQNQIALEKAFEDAKQGEKVKSLFMANMSHEIRTPLNTILGFTDLVEETTRDLLSEEEKTFFNVISTSGKRLMRTVHEILDISQLDAGTVVIVKEVFNLVPMIQEMVHGMRIQAEEKQLDLTFHSTRKEILVYADKEGITHSISNIIDNAIKYTDEGSITLSLRQKSRKAILTIKDTGIGMSKEYLNNLFEAFTQESEGYTKDYQGIGLGSAIVKGHLDLNEVDISVESTKGKGTTFTLTFPEPNKISNKTKNVKNSNENKDS